MKRQIATLLLVLGIGISAMAGSPRTTTISDTVYTPQGTPFSGQMIISNPQFISPDGYNVPSNTQTVTVTNGIVDLNLIPTVGTIPVTSNQYYTITFTTVPTMSQYWMPYSSNNPLTIEQVQVYPPLPPLPSTPPPLNVSQGGTGATTSQQAINNLTNGNSITAQSVNGILNAAQFAGSDPGAQINAAEAALPTYGGVIDLRQYTGVQTMTTQVVITKPTVLLFGDADFVCDAVASPCFYVQSSLVRFIGLAQGIGPDGGSNEYNISYTGDPSALYQVVDFSNPTTGAELAYSGMRDMYINVIDTSTAAAPIPEIDAINVKNPVEDDFVNLYVHHAADHTNGNDPIVGIHLENDSTGLVPPSGYTRIVNYIYADDTSSGTENPVLGSGSAGIWADGTTGGLNHIRISGPCDIEPANYDIRFTDVYSSEIDDCYLNGGQYGIYFVGDQDNFVKDVHINGLNTNAYYIDSGSYDNQFKGISMTASTAGVDNGNRTSWYNTNNGNVSFPLLAGPTNGAAATSSANVNSTEPCFLGAYWTGSASTEGGACIQTVMQPGSNPSVAVNFTPDNLTGSYPEYYFEGNSLYLQNSSTSANAWVAFNNGYTEQTADARLDVNSISSPTSWFDIGGTPTAERTVTLPDATGQVIETGTGGGIASGQTLTNAGTIDNTGTLDGAGTANLSGMTVPGFSVASTPSPTVMLGVEPLGAGFMVTLF